MAGCASSAGSILSKNGDGVISCLCKPGWFSRNGSSCELFKPLDSAKLPQADNSSTVFDPPLDFRTYSAGATAQRWFFYSTLATVGLWLIITVALRLMPLHGWWFRIRYFISRWDRRFSKRHWLDEQKVQVKRRTELGGACSIASFIFLGGLATGLIYELVVSAKVTQQSLIPANGREMLSYNGDYSFNITTVSSMKCSQASGYDVLYTGLSFDKNRSDELKEEAKVTLGCEDTEVGPMVYMMCMNCRFARDNYFLQFAFRDEPGAGLLASAVGFAFSVATQACNSKICLSVNLKGMLAGATDGVSTPNATLRGPSTNVLEFRMIPRLFQRETGSGAVTSRERLLNYSAIPSLFHRNKESVILVETVFHSYVAGDYYTNATGIQASLDSPSEVVVMVQNKILSSYIVETRQESTIGFVQFLARLGGIYVLSLSVFFFMMMQSELRIKSLRYDDKLLNRLEARRQAQARWDKVRLYVRYANFHRMLSLRLDPEPTDAAADDDLSRHVSMARDSSSRHVSGSPPRSVSRPAGLGSFPSDVDSWRPEKLHDVSDTPTDQSKLQPSSSLPRSASLSSASSSRRTPSSLRTPPVTQWLAVKMLERNVSKRLEREEALLSAMDRSIELQEVRVDPAGEGGASTSLRAEEDPPPLNTSRKNGSSRSQGVGRDSGPSKPVSAGEGATGGEASGQVEDTPRHRRNFSFESMFEKFRDSGKGKERVTGGESEGKVGDTPRGHHRTFSVESMVEKLRDASKVSLPRMRLPSSGDHGHDEVIHHRRKVRERKGYGSSSRHKGTIVRQYRQPSWLTDADPLPELPQPPQPPQGTICAADKFAMYNHLQDMYEYRVRLRERFLLAESMLEDVVQRFRPHSDL